MDPIDEIQGHVNSFMQEQNNRPVPEFEGYSTFEMQHILYDTFGEIYSTQIGTRKIGFNNLEIIS